MATKKEPFQTQPTLKPDRALRELSTQLDRLQKLKNRSYQEARTEETEWEQLTQAVVEGAFEKPSSSLIIFEKREELALMNPVWRE